MDATNKYQRRFDRERKARKRAEEILESKSRELFEKNEQLKILSKDLECQVLERTRELTEARDQALSAVKSKSEFIANMSHELRTPMNGVLGMLHILEGTKLNIEQRKHIDIIRSSGELLLEVINGVLDFSKIEANKLKLENIAFCPAKLLDQTCAPLKHIALGKGLKFKQSIANFPDVILGDPTRLKQIITNLLSNAIKFTEDGEVEISIEKCPKPTVSYYQIRVKDSGIGMQKAQLDKIFNAFDQADSSITRTHGGTGLGLTITDSLSKMMGGHIEVKSEYGLGSEFKVILPLQISQEQPECSPQQKQQRQFNKQRVLLVEDNLVNQKIAKHFLLKLNLTPIIANDGFEAIQMAQEQSFDIILMDLQMPKMDGLQATKTIRALGPDYQSIPIIAMTAHADEEHKKECFDFGMNDHIAKPVKPEQLSNILAQWLLKHSINETA